MALPTVDLSVHLNGKCHPSTRSTSLKRVWHVPSLTATKPQSNKKGVVADCLVAITTHCPSPPGTKGQEGWLRLVLLLVPVANDASKWRLKAFLSLERVA